MEKCKCKSTRLIYNDDAHIQMYESMPAEDFKELMMQVFRYKYGDAKEPKFRNPMTMAIWMMMKKEIDFNEEKWKKKAETSRKNGANGGRPKRVADEEEFDPEFSNPIELG